MRLTPKSAAITHQERLIRRLNPRFNRTIKSSEVPF